MNQKMKYILMISLLIVGISVLLGGCSNKAKIGYIDISRVATESPQLKVLNDNFEKEYKPFTEQMEDLSKKQDSMSKEDYTKAVQDLQRKVYGVQQKYNAQRQALIDKILEQISKEKGLSAVTIKSSAGIDPTAPEENAASVDGVVVQGGIDVTDEVIQKLQ